MREPATQADSEEEHPVEQLADALVESPSDDKAIVETVRAAAVSLEHPAEHAPVVSPDEWHGGAEAAGNGVVDGLDPFGGILGAIAASISEAGAEGAARAAHKSKKERRLIQGLADRSIVVDPAVSFAPGSYCLIVTKPSGDLAVLPGDKASKREHRDKVLSPARARDWARQIRDLPDIRLSPGQTDAITAWVDRASKHGPTVIFFSRPQAQPDAADNSAGH